MLLLICWCNLGFSLHLFNVDKLLPTLVNRGLTDPGTSFVRPVLRIGLQCFLWICEARKIKESQSEVNLLCDSGPWCVSSCGPSRLHINTQKHTHQPTVVQTFNERFPPSPSSPPLQFSSCRQCFLFWYSKSFNTTLSCSVACLAQRPIHTPSALTVKTVWAQKTCLKHKQKKERKPVSLPPYMPCSNPLPPALTSSPLPHLHFLLVCLCQQNFRPWLLRMNFETVWVTFVHLRVCLSGIGENLKKTKNFPFCPPLCASMWELLSPSSWTLTFDQTLIKSLVVVVKRGSYVGTGEAPLSTHSQCFIYGPLHFWLWWLQYLSSYLNCIFKDFIQYLHAIQYELIFLCQFFFFYFLFNCLDFGMFCHYYSQTNMPVEFILGVKCCYWDVPCMFLCIMIPMTAEQHEAGVGKCLLDERNFVITLYF